VTNGDQELADLIADDMNQFYWNHREDFVFKEIFNTEDGVRHALEAVGKGRTPVVIADGCDRTGGATWITSELIRRGASNFCVGTLTDPGFFDLVSSRQLKKGDHTGPVKVGGTTDIFSGDPVALEDAVIEFINNQYVVLLFGDNNRIVVSKTLVQVTDPGWHARVGVDFSKLEIVVHKTRVHFFRGYYETGIAGDEYQGTIVKIEVPSWGPADVTKIKYVNGGQYLYPLDMNREMGYITDRPYIGDKDMVYQTGEGLVLKK
jgi:microcystin degradation protein MlrC